MNKFLYIIVLVFCSYTISYAKTFDKINQQEYPNADTVIPSILEFSKNSTVKGTVSNEIKIDLPLCIRIALGNNPKINAAFQDILISNAKIRQVWANYFPTFSWQTSYTRLRQLQLSDAFSENIEYNYFILGQITLHQLLYDFGVTQNDITIQRLNREASKSTFEDVVNDIIYQVKIAYYNVLLAQETKRIEEDSLNKNVLFYNQAKGFYKTGSKSKIDVTTAETNLSNSKLELIKAIDNIATTYTNLNNVLGVSLLNEYNVSDKIAYNHTDITFNQAINIAKESNPALKLAIVQIERANQTYKLAKKSFLPQITMDLEAQRGGKSINSNYGYSLGGYLKFTDVNILLINNKIKENKYLYYKSIANAIDTRNTVYLNIQNTLIDLNSINKQIAVSLLQLKQAKENYELSFGRYKVGVGNALELKDAENSYKVAQLNYYKCLYNYNCQIALLEKYIGKKL